MDQDLKDMIFEMFDYEDEELTIIKDGDWISDGKWENRESIVEYQGKYYMIDQSRSGSYYTDYHYDDPRVYEVNKRVEMVETVFWDRVKT